MGYMAPRDALLATAQTRNRTNPNFWAAVAAKLWMQVELENSEYLSAAIVEFIARDGDALEQVKVWT